MRSRLVSPNLKSFYWVVVLCACWWGLAIAAGASPCGTYRGRPWSGSGLAAGHRRGHGGLTQGLTTHQVCFVLASFLLFCPVLVLLHSPTPSTSSTSAKKCNFYYYYYAPTRWMVWGVLLKTWRLTPGPLTCRLPVTALHAGQQIALVHHRWFGLLLRRVFDPFQVQLRISQPQVKLQQPSHHQIKTRQSLLARHHLPRVKRFGWLCQR